jgi:hypothetical protein
MNLMCSAGALGSQKDHSMHYGHQEDDGRTDSWKPEWVYRMTGFHMQKNMFAP